VRYISVLTVGHTQLLCVISPYWLWGTHSFLFNNCPRKEARQSTNTGGLLQVCGVRIFSHTRCVHMSCILYPQHLCNMQGSFIVYISMKFVSPRILNTVCQWHQLAGFLWHNLRILNWKNQDGRWLVNYQGLSRVILEVQSGFIYVESATNEKCLLI